MANGSVFDVKAAMSAFMPKDSYYSPTTSMSKSMNDGDMYLFFTQGGDTTLNNEHYGCMLIAVGRPNFIAVGTIFKGDLITVTTNGMSIDISAPTRLAMGYAKLAK